MAKSNTVKPAKCLSEDHVQEMIVKFIDIQFKDWIYQVNWLSGAKLPIGLAVKAKRKGHKKNIPDLMIFQPCGKFFGLFIELKRDDALLRNKSGGYHDEHIEQQAITLKALRERGYAACFAFGFDEAINILKEYAGLDNTLTKSNAFLREKLI